ncbi:helix-turn-helix domain-containing protein [Streptomyces sp. NPDC057027]|uniref:helix-turn-helix domain-containing protein n=1 Tax=Streptomyces sp. NPDC057027 TaxID=3346004 RepID=UPI00362AEE5F
MTAESILRGKGVVEVPLCDFRACSPLLVFSLVLWVRRLRGWDSDAVSFKPSPVVPPLTRPQLAEARRVRAAELFDQGRSGAEIARMLGVGDESVRRWKRV